MSNKRLHRFLTPLLTLTLLLGIASAITLSVPQEAQAATSYKVTYKANGGKVNKNKKATYIKKVKKKKKLGTLPKATKAGYVISKTGKKTKITSLSATHIANSKSAKAYKFKGWFTKKKGGKKVTKTFKVKRSIKLYARYSEYVTTKAGAYVKKTTHKDDPLALRWTCDVCGAYKVTEFDYDETIQGYPITKHKASCTRSDNSSVNAKKVYKAATNVVVDGHLDDVSNPGPYQENYSYPRQWSNAEIQAHLDIVTGFATQSTLHFYKPEYFLGLGGKLWTLEGNSLSTIEGVDSISTAHMSAEEMIAYYASHGETVNGVDSWQVRLDAYNQGLNAPINYGEIENLRTLFPEGPASVVDVWSPMRGYWK